jgi:carbonic anhydrase
LKKPIKNPATMIRKILCYTIIAAITWGCAALFYSYDDNTVEDIDGKELVVPEKALRERVLTAAEQAALTPQRVLESLIASNVRFVNNDLTLRNHTVMVRKASQGQYPKAVILSCLDSRVPVEDIFDKGIGDLFIARVAGNFANTDMLGSMEYGCKVSGAKLIVVLGHHSCGAVKAAIDNFKLGNISAMLQNISPAIKRSASFTGEKNSKNRAYIDYVTEQNVLAVIASIRNNSPVLRQMAEEGKLKIVGGIYDLQDGKVTFLAPDYGLE